MVPDFVAYHAHANPSRYACRLLPGLESLTYSEFDDYINRYGSWLTDRLGAGSGKRVALLARNGFDILALHFACIRVGAIFQPLNWRLTGPELNVLLEDADAEILLYQAEFKNSALKALDGITVPLVHLLDDDFVEGIRHNTPLPPQNTDPDQPVTLLYTSGTTGRSKGVIITGNNAYATAQNFSAIAEVGPRDTLLCDVPMFHVAGLFGVARAALLMGGTILISDRFQPAVTLGYMSDPALFVTHYFAVPQMAVMMQRDPAYATADLSGMKAIICGGAPVEKLVVERYAADGVCVLSGYGLSEAGTVFGLPLDLDVIVEKSDTSGLIAQMIEARIVNADGNDVPVGEIGEIWLRGPSITPGYWNQPDATAATFQDGWFKTGDAAVQDAEGFYRIVDRWKDMYISGGENVYPAEVEAELLSLENIVEAAVIGVADDKWGESGCAYVVKDGDITEQQIIDHCRAHLAAYKVPKYIRFTDELVRTASGKVQKKALRDDFGGE